MRDAEEARGNLCRLSGEDGRIIVEAIEEIKEKGDLDVAGLLRLALLDIERLREFEDVRPGLLLSKTDTKPGMYRRLCVNCHRMLG
jgi:hypothetical protein